MELIYVLRLVTGDEIVCELDVLDMTSDELTIMNPMEIVSGGSDGAMYLRASTMLSSDRYLVIPTSKIVYSYHPSDSLVTYYNLSVQMYEDEVIPVVNSQILKSARAIEEAYDEIDSENKEAMDLLRELLKEKKSKKDLH